MIPGAGGTQRLTKAVGKSTAMEMVLTGRNFSADDAEKRGLISRVVREGNVVDEAVKVASTIAKKGQIAVQAAKEGVNACRFPFLAPLPARRCVLLFSKWQSTDSSSLDGGVIGVQQPSNLTSRKEPGSNVASSKACSQLKTRKKAWRLSPRKGRPLLRTSNLHTPSSYNVKVGPGGHAQRVIAGTIFPESSTFSQAPQSKRTDPRP